MKLPNGHRALVDVAKLRDYCLSRTHPRGRHKARVFEASLGLTAGDAGALRSALLEAAASGQAKSGEVDEHGRRYIVDFRMVGPSGEAVVRSAWIIRAGEDTPRFTSCYVL